MNRPNVRQTTIRLVSLALVGVTLVAVPGAISLRGAPEPVPKPAATPLNIEEATIADIQKALLAKQLTTADVVGLYLTRIKAYNGTCVDQP